MPETRALLLDIGGVIVQDQWSLAAAELATELGVDAEVILRALRDAAPRLDLGRISLADFGAEVAKAVGQPIGPSRFRRLALDASLVLLPQNLGELDRLRRVGNLRIVGLTNVGPEIARALERKFRLSSHFDCMARSYELGARKPNRLFFDRALALAKVARANSFFVDDDARNVEAARALGIRAVTLRKPEAFVGLIRRRFPMVSSGSNKPIDRLARRRALAS